MLAASPRIFAAKLSMRLSAETSSTSPRTPTACDSFWLTVS